MALFCGHLSSNFETHTYAPQECVGLEVKTTTEN